VIVTEAGKLFIMRILKDNEFQRAQLGYLEREIKQSTQGQLRNHSFWDAIRQLVHVGLCAGEIEYAKRYQSEKAVWFDVPTANLWQFYNEICRDLEGLPFAFNNISRKTFTRRLLRNKNCERKKVRYKKRVVVSVVWGTNQSFFDWIQKWV
jgi:hypothetical protein